MKIFNQLLLILIINFIGEALSHFLQIPVPGSIIGMVLLLILLIVGIVKPEHIKETADFLLNNMGFFFIPAGVGILVAYPFLKGFYVEATSVILVSTLIVLIITSLVTQYLVIRKERKDELAD